jgi:hypothetical protein
MEEKSNKKYQPSHVSPQHGIIEMLYDPVAEKTSFAKYYDGVLSIGENVELSPEKVIHPLSPQDDRIRLSVIKLPSEVGSYATVEMLYRDISQFIKEYVSLPPKFLAVSSAYVMMSWLYDKFQVVPYLRVIGDWGTGKSRFLEVVGSICYRPIMYTGSASNASIFRMIADISGTMLLDEADFQESEKHTDIVKLLNAGHKKGGAVQRAEANAKNNTFTIKTFPVFGPKVIGSRERWKDNALESRCLTHVMLTKQSVNKPVGLPDSFEDEARRLRNNLLKFRFENYNQIELNENTVTDLTIPRIRQCMLPITTIAELINDPEVKSDILSFGKDIEEDLIRTQAVSDEADILVCIGRLMQASKPKIYMQNIADEYNLKFGSGSTPANLIDHSRLDISSHKVGHIVHKKLLLRPTRDNKGVYIPVAHEKKRIESLMVRYGITDQIIGIKNSTEPNPQ